MSIKLYEVIEPISSTEFIITVARLFPPTIVKILPSSYPEPALTLFILLTIPSLLLPASITKFLASLFESLYLIVVSSSSEAYILSGESIRFPSLFGIWI